MWPKTCTLKPRKCSCAKCALSQGREIQGWELKLKGDGYKDVCECVVTCVQVHECGTKQSHLCHLIAHRVCVCLHPRLAPCETNLPAASGHGTTKRQVNAKSIVVPSTQTAVATVLQKIIIIIIILCIFMFIVCLLGGQHWLQIQSFNHRERTKNA